MILRGTRPPRPGDATERAQFLSLPQAEGDNEVVEAAREPGGMPGMHCHPSEALAPILAGEIRTARGQAGRGYRPGEIFPPQADAPHTGRCGPGCVRYHVGRR